MNRQQRRAAKSRNTGPTTTHNVYSLSERGKAMAELDDMPDHGEPRWLNSTVVVPDPSKLDDLIVELRAHDFEVELLDFISDDGARWLKVRVLSHRSDNSYLLWLFNLIDPFGAMGAEVVENERPLGRRRLADPAGVPGRHHLAGSRTEIKEKTVTGRQPAIPKGQPAMPKSLSPEQI